MSQNELLEFETKIMTPSTPVEKEARKLLMESKTLKDEILQKYEGVLEPFIEKQTKTEIYKGFLRLVRTIYLPSPNKNWTVLDFSTLKVDIPELKDAFFEHPLIQDIWKLDLTWRNTSKISPKITTLEGLHDLFLSYCELKEIPEAVFQIKKLQDLVLLGNHLKTLPTEIENLQQLEYLNVASNQLKSLPDSVFNLPALQSLYVQRNYGLKEISPAIGDLSNLQQLDISGCPIESLPDSFWALKNFTYLTFSGTKLKDIPDEIFECPNLRKLDVSGTAVSPARKKELKEKLGDIVKC